MLPTTQILVGSIGEYKTVYDGPGLRIPDVVKVGDQYYALFHVIHGNAKTGQPTQAYYNHCSTLELSVKDEQEIEDAPIPSISEA